MVSDLQIEYRGIKVSVTKHRLTSTEIFRVAFDDNRQPLIISIARKESGRNFWTSIPEGRQKEAEEIGNLITNHFKLF